MPIQILSGEVASQIAAGEVVERPASVIKELVENALDAGASQITVQVDGAGKVLIEVSDNGSGIPAGELRLAVARHATSKLQTAEDLFHIQTLGFRGEALASVASVSNFKIVSRPEVQQTGLQMRVDGGTEHEPEAIGVPQGTVVRVENLFYNVPARLKFLKRDQTEREAINALLVRYALAYPQVRFRLIMDGKTTLQSNGNGDRREIMAQLYGVELARQMLEVIFEDHGMRVDGFISPVSLTRSNRREITFFVNGRWVQDISLSTALLRAYHTLLMVGRYPLAVLFVTIPPEAVDVNVHPAKAEVRFREPETIFSGLQRAVRRALMAYSPVPRVTPATYWQSEAPAQPSMIDPAWDMAGELKSTSQGDVSAVVEEDESGESIHPEQPLAESVPNLPSGRMPLLRIIGQVGAAYLVAEGPDGLYLIDQHAAHERVLFERYHKQTLAATIPSQSLLVPVTFTLTPQSAHQLEKQLDVLEKIGFQVEEFGMNTFRVRAIPALFKDGDPVAAVRVVVEDFEEDETPLQTEIEDRLIARICKRMAVKAGKIMSPEEQRVLIQDLEACQSPRTCPHGRPTMIHLSVDLLERQFGRRGAR